MVKEAEKKERFNSWKEIASYLDADVRTCRRYELRFNLPVHRIQDSPKSRVFAYKEELDDWLTKKGSNNNFKAVQKSSPLSRRFVIPLLAVAALVVIFFLAGGFKKRLPPYDFKIEGSQLIILDENGKQLWQHNSGRERLRGKDHYREFYQVSVSSDKRGGRRNFPQLMLKDLDGDGSKEVLFAIKTKDYLNEGILLCINDRGDKLWEFDTGQELTYGESTFSSDSRIVGFETIDLDGDGNLEIVCLAHQLMRFPSQVLLINSVGEMKGNYWNAGRITDFSATDLDEDGKMELVCCGLNNEGGVGCIFVLDPWNMKGASPQREAQFITNDLEAGSQLHYIRLPRTKIDLSHSIMNSTKNLNILSNGHINVYTSYTNIIYEFDQELQLVDINFSHTYITIHNQAYSDGLIDINLDDDAAIKKYKQWLADQIEYYDGKKWTSK